MTQSSSRFTRRIFLWRGSVAAGVAGAVATVPGLPALLATDAPEASTAADAAAPEAASLLPGEAATFSEPLVAHIRDLATGEIDLYIGDQQIAYVNRGIATQLFRATKG
jgi:hypothetical protein